MNIRNLVLWVTGRDLLKLSLPPPPNGVYFIAQPEERWEMMFAPPSTVCLRFCLPIGPNVLHRLAQRVIFGIRWRMLPIPEGKQLCTSDIA